MAWILDLDGVIWRGDQPVPGSARAVERLRAAGEDVWFVTNNALPRRGDVANKLRDHGIDPGDQVVTSPMAAASLIEPGERVLSCAGAGVVEALTERGAEVVDAGDRRAVEAGGPWFDAVVVGLHLDFDYGRLAAAATAVRGGARLVATNDDSTYPAADGVLLPGAGSILAAVEAASGATAIVAGKPYAPMADLVRGLAGPTGIAVGDRADTDGRFAAALGYPFGLVLTGVTRAEHLPVTPAPDLIAADLATLVQQALGS
ncbi:MAG: HAD-IIA family hydrolase [Acidimicrobiales bacterium]